jgi:hypothetical protein
LTATPIPAAPLALPTDRRQRYRSRLSPDRRTGN